jgi:hypothetical protein
LVVQLVNTLQSIIVQSICTLVVQLVNTLQSIIVQSICTLVVQLVALRGRDVAPTKGHHTWYSIVQYEYSTV